MPWRVAAAARWLPLLRVGALEIEPAVRKARLAGREIDLTSREWAVLDRLLVHPGAVVSKAQIEDALYAFGSEVESNAVEVYVSRLRKKIGASQHRHRARPRLSAGRPREACPPAWPGG